MNILRSEKIKRYSCVVPYQTAFETVGMLISSGCIEIETRAEEDTKNSFFVVLSRIRALRVKLEKLLVEIETQYKVPVRRLTFDQRHILIAKMKSKLQEANTEYLKYLDSEEEKIERKLSQIDTIANNFKKLRGMHSQNLQEKDIARAKLQIFRGNQSHHEFSLITGVCSSEQKQMVERFIFRASRGHSYVIFIPRYSDPRSLVMFAFVGGSAGSLLHAKIVKLCQCANIALYELPNNESNLERYMNDLEKREQELVALVALSQKNLAEQVAYYNFKPESPRIIKKLVKMRFLERIAYILCHQTQTTSTTHFLVSFHKPEKEQMPSGLNVYESQQGQFIPRTCMPNLPILYEANLLTELFSVPRHDEIIPSVFMFATLPVLFGMMYSDIGHGCMLLAVSLTLNLGGIWVLMSCMSIYFGLLFNEFFGMKVGLMYRVTGGRFSIDPLWGAAHNSLAFENSLKMKLSIIMGAVHMLFGMLLRIWNQIHLKKYLSVVYESIPKLVVFLCTVGYMVYLILLKWTINFKGKESTAPSIISMVLQMYLGYHEGARVSLFSSMAVEKEIAHYLKVVCAICLFFIMFGKSIHEKLARPSRSYSRLEEEEEEEDVYGLRESKPNSDSQSEAEHFGPLEGFEYVLSLISSITSYLRLFALSLSHQKLSHLLLTFLLGPLSEMHPRVSLVRSFAFFLITIAMMLMLDVMECIMHVIRLHWVEWMGKFYTGGGRRFKPELIDECY